MSVVWGWLGQLGDAWEDGVDDILLAVADEEGDAAGRVRIDGDRGRRCARRWGRR